MSPAIPEPGGLTGIHPTKQGALYLSVHSNHFFAALCELIGRPELARDPRCATMHNRAAHSTELAPELQAALAARTALEWEEIFGERVPGAAVRRIEDMFDHPQVLAEDLVTRLDHPVVGHYRTMTKPVKFSDTPRPSPGALPTFGQHSDEVLASYAIRRRTLRPCAGAASSGEASVAKAMAMLHCRRDARLAAFGRITPVRMNVVCDQPKPQATVLTPLRRGLLRGDAAVDDEPRAGHEGGVIRR